MARLIKTGSAGKDRVLLEKGVVIALRELLKQSALNKQTYDLVAYIALSLQAIGETINDSVAGKKGAIGSKLTITERSGIGLPHWVRNCRNPCLRKIGER